MNDDSETKFQSSINKYQKDSQKKYMPYGQKENNAKKGDSLNNTTLQTETEDANVKIPQNIQRYNV